MNTDYQRQKRRHFAQRLDMPLVPRRKHRRIPIAPVAVEPDISDVWTPKRANLSMSVLGRAE